MKLRKNTTLAGLKSLKGSVIQGRTGSKVRLREKKLGDVRNDYKWQSDAELAKLDAAPTLIMPFSVYLLDYATEIHRPRDKRYPLAVETIDGTHIGNCTCYDIDDKKSEAQLGIMIGDREYWDKGYGTDAVNALVDHVFETTTINRLYLKTLPWNVRAQKCFQKCGFTPCGKMNRNGYEFLLMELNREQWEKCKNTK
ncbi:MAG: GNAT family N-acetyltransferase [Dehalococcoidales bacterium]|nr:GNAT family N-acetyltransferase [Dehalococcoidales bacterium]